MTVTAAVATGAAAAAPDESGIATGTTGGSCARRWSVRAEVMGSVEAATVFYSEPGSAEVGQATMSAAEGEWVAEVPLGEGDYDVVVAATGPAGTASAGAGRVTSTCEQS